MLSFAANLALVHAAASKLLLSCSCFFAFPPPPPSSLTLFISSYIAFWLQFISLFASSCCYCRTYLPQVQSFFCSSLPPSLSLALFLSLSVLHYSSALAWPFAVVWGQLEPGSWSTGGSILSQALNLRASNCIKSVSSDLSLALPTPTVLVVPAAHPLRHPFTLDNFSFVSPPLLLCAEAFHIVDADVPLYALSLTLSLTPSLLYSFSHWANSAK